MLCEQVLSGCTRLNKACICAAASEKRPAFLTAPPPHFRPEEKRAHAPRWNASLPRSLFLLLVLVVA